MNIKFYLLIISLLFLYTNTAFGQISSIEKYNLNINSAELLITEKQYSQAFEIYYELLLSSDGNFVKDIYNSLILAIEVSEVDKFYELLDLLLVKNLNSSYIQSDSAFMKFHNDEEWKEFIINNDKVTIPELNLRNSIDSMFNADQYFRGRVNSYTTYMDTISKIDSSNMNFLVQLIRKGNFPGENNIGTKRFRGGSGYDIIFHHYLQFSASNKDKKKLAPLLINLITSGKILSNSAAYWIGLEKGDFNAGVNDVYRFQRTDGSIKTYVMKYNDLERDIVDNYRQIIHAESLDDYYQKIIFALNNPKSKYIFDIKFSLLKLDDEMIERITKNMIELN